MNLLVPLQTLSYRDLFLVAMVVVMDQFKGHVGQRLIGASSTRFYVGMELFSNVLFLILGSGLRILHESSTVMGTVVVILTSLAAVAFVQKDSKRKAQSN